jgi:hypothetical protein
MLGLMSLRPVSLDMGPSWCGWWREEVVLRGDVKSWSDVMPSPPPRIAIARVVEMAVGTGSTGHSRGLHGLSTIQGQNVPYRVARV